MRTRTSRWPTEPGSEPRGRPLGIRQSRSAKQLRTNHGQTLASELCLLSMANPKRRHKRRADCVAVATTNAGVKRSAGNRTEGRWGCIATPRRLAAVASRAGRRTAGPLAHTLKPARRSKPSAFFQNGRARDAEAPQAARLRSAALRWAVLGPGLRMCPHFPRQHPEKAQFGLAPAGTWPRRGRASSGDTSVQAISELAPCEECMTERQPNSLRPSLVITKMILAIGTYS